MIKGNDIIIIQDGTAIACAKSCEINVEADVQEICSPTTGTWREFVAKRKEWSISISTLISTVKTPINLVGSTVTLQIGSVTEGERTLSADKVTGTAIINSWKCTATRGNLSSGSFKFRGTGALQ